MTSACPCFGRGCEMDSLPYGWVRRAERFDLMMGKFQPRSTLIGGRRDTGVARDIVAALSERLSLAAVDIGLAPPCRGNGRAIRCGEFDFLGIASIRRIVCHGHFLSRDGISYWLPGIRSAPQTKAT